jgi:hypothetical protein
VLRVGHDQRVMVAGHAEEHVGRKTVEASGILRENASGRVTYTRGATVELVEGAASLDVRGQQAVMIGGRQVVHVARSADLVVGKVGERDHHAVTVEGDHVLAATGRATLRADEGFVIACGSSRIVVGPEGVTIRGKAIEILGSETVRVAAADGKGPTFRLDAQGAEVAALRVQLLAEEASLALDHRAVLKGKAVKLGGVDEGKATNGGAATAETQPFRMVLSDAEFGVWAGKHYHLKVDGEKLEGTTGPDGLISRDIPRKATSVTLIVWIDAYPTGRTKTRTITVGPLPAPDTARGALVRLAHLGYSAAEARDDVPGQLDEAGTAAVKDFQTHLGLPPTGQLDTATVAKLVEVHGT